MQLGPRGALQASALMVCQRERKRKRKREGGKEAGREGERDLDGVGSRQDGRGCRVARVLCMLGMWRAAAACAWLEASRSCCGVLQDRYRLGSLSLSLSLSL